MRPVCSDSSGGVTLFSEIRTLLSLGCRESASHMGFLCQCFRGERRTVVEWGEVLFSQTPSA